MEQLQRFNDIYRKAIFSKQLKGFIESQYNHLIIKVLSQNTIQHSIRGFENVSHTDIAPHRSRQG